MAAIEPAQLRVAARVDAPALALDPDGMRLTLELTPRSGGAVEHHAFRLRAARTADARLTPAGGRPWQVFALDEAGLRAMRALQPRLAEVQRHYSQFSFSVASGFDGAVPAGTREVLVSVRLQLSAEQAPLSLFERAPIPFERD